MVAATSNPDGMVAHPVAHQGGNAVGQPVQQHAAAAAAAAAQPVATTVTETVQQHNPNDNLVAHLRHPLQVTFRCGVCQECFATQEQCQAHVMTHLGQIPQIQLPSSPPPVALNFTSTANTDHGLTAGQQYVQVPAGNGVQHESLPQNVGSIPQGTNNH